MNVVRTLRRAGITGVYARTGLNDYIEGKDSHLGAKGDYHAHL